MTYKFKEGDRVRHVNDPEDEGVFIEYTNGEYSRVVWNNYGDTAYNLTENLYLAALVSTEQEAVMLLLSLGYTVSKH